MGTRAGLDKCGKSRPPPPPGFDPRTVQPVASRYTDYATRGTLHALNSHKYDTLYCAICCLAMYVGNKNKKNRRIPKYEHQNARYFFTNYDVIRGSDWVTTLYLGLRHPNNSESL